MGGKRTPSKPRGPWVAVVGARPNFVKLAPLLRAARAARRELLWIHTGQHTHARLSASMARDLGLPPPVGRLRAPPPSPARIETMAGRLARPLARLQPSLVVVVGDVDSTVAGALAARAARVPLAHVEAGLRSGDPTMPEERNRILVDGLSDCLHLTEPSAAVNLRAEGIAAARMRRSGNVMADALRWNRARIAALTSDAERRWGRRGYVVATLHRQASVDDPARLAGFARALARLGEDLPVVFPVHPRTAARLGLQRATARRQLRGVVSTPPLGYLAFLALVRAAALVVTDSGGLQVEAALLRVPCVTARRSTEHLLTLEHGNRLAGGDPRRLPAVARDALAAGVPPGRRPRAWDGRAAERMVRAWRAGVCFGAHAPARIAPALRKYL